MPIRVVLADDHPIVRTGIRNLLIKTEDIHVVAEATTGAEALKCVQEHTPDVLLLDMEMPGLQGVDVARRLRSMKSPVHILALSAYDDKQYIQEMLEQGAAGYLTKDEAPENIVEAVRGVARGEQGWLSRKIAAKMTTWIRDDEQDLRKLTLREMEVLRLLTEGKTNQGIGMALGISEKTVEKYLDSMFKKMGVNSRVDAAVRAVREGII